MSKKEKIYIGVLVLVLIGSLIFMIFQFFNASHTISEVEAVPIIVEEPTVIPPDIQEDIQHVTQLNPLTDEELIARVVMAEAENQEMVGKVAVAIVILNRADWYEQDVQTVIDSPNQFADYKSVVPNGDCYKAVRIARQSRELFPENMIYFRAGSYHDKYGKPYVKIQDHYFSVEVENEKSND